MFVNEFAVGSTRYGPMDYSGTIYVKDSEGSDYLGVVFAYQSNRKFYIVMWRRETINFGKSDTNAGIKGLQLKVRGIHRAHKLYTDCDRLQCNRRLGPAHIKP